MSQDIASELPMSQDVSSDPHEVQNTVEGTSSPVKKRARFPSFEQIKMCDTGTQCNLGTETLENINKLPEDQNISDTDSMFIDDPRDSDFSPDSSLVETCTDEDHKNKNSTVNPTKKIEYFLVKYSKLTELFSTCPVCNKISAIKKEWMTGTMISVVAVCVQGHVRKWNSQPIYMKQQPEGNATVTAGLMLAGLSFTKFAEFSEIICLAMISPPIFHKIRNNYFEPLLVENYNKQNVMVKEEIISRGSVILAGDGQFDSPGHSAEKVIYSYQDVETGKIVGFEVATKDMHPGECLEKCAFNKSFPRLADDLPITIFASDRQVSIRSTMKTLFPQIKHEFDAWHVGKSYRKYLKQILVKYPKLLCWIESIIYHLIWVSQSSNGDGKLVVEKVKSLLFHIIGKHEWEGFQKFHHCEHGEIPS